MTLKPISFRTACAFVAEHHRHHRPPQGCKFSLGAFAGDELLGVVIVGRPVARNLDDGWTAEVTRLCTKGDRNVASFLYGAARRVCQAMGYRKVLTYILADEPGTTLRAAGWTQTAESGGGSWSRPSRGRTDKAPLDQKVRYEAECVKRGHHAA